jgi:hypothetical protein
MSSAISSAQPTRTPSFARRGQRSRSALCSRTAASHDRIASAARLIERDCSRSSTLLARYLDTDGRVRELFALQGHGGSVLVVDRDAATLCDRRLLAHLSADEPAENAEIVCEHYLKDRRGRWCRAMCPEDLKRLPLACETSLPGAADCVQSEPDRQDAPVAGSDGRLYRLSPVQAGRSGFQMRWWRCADSEEARWELASLREVIGAVENYEPMRALSERAIARHEKDQKISVARLRSELDRLCDSPVVLNRRLREVVLEAVDRGETSMSQIALRCGIVKRDRRGRISGETSWLARRIGIMPEGGETAITPWIHSEVLGAIARKGLRISPREVELQ